MSGENVKKVSLNLNGQEVVLNRGTNIKNIKSIPEKLLYTIFDLDGSSPNNLCYTTEAEQTRNWKLSKLELQYAKQFEAGIFNIQHDANKIKLTYTEDVDKDGKPEYTSTWTFDENDNWIERTRDSNGDGNIDECYTRTYHGNGQVSEHTGAYYDNGILSFKSTMMFNNNGEFLGVKDEYHAGDE